MEHKPTSFLKNPIFVKMYFSGIV